MEDKEKLPRHTRLVWATVIVALAGLIPVVLPAIGLLLMFTGVGLPLAWLYLAFPTMAFVAVPAMIIYLLVPAAPAVRCIVAMAVTPLLLYLPPAILNPGIQADAEGLASGDFNHIVEPFRFKTVAYREEVRFAAGASRCNEHCLLTLLSGAAERVIVPLSNNPLKEFDPNEAATEFSLPYQAGCLPKNVDEAKPSDRGRDIDLVDILNLRISEGQCLVEMPTVLKAADIIISRTNLTESRYPSVEDEGFNLSTGMASGFRTSIHKAEDNAADTREIYRKTFVRYKLLGAFLVPVKIFDRAWIGISFGWLRSDLYAYDGVSSPNDLRTDIRDIAGLLDQSQSSMQQWFSQTKSDVRQKIFEKIDLASLGEREVSAAEWQMVLSYHRHIDLWDSNDELNRRDLSLMLRLFENPNLPPFPYLYEAVRNSEKEKPQDVAKLASLLFDRLQRGQTWPDTLQYGTKDALESIASGIIALPEDAAQPHLKSLFDRLKAEASQTAGSRLADDVYRDGVAPLLLKLIEPHVNRGLATGDVDGRKAFADALQGLCYAGLRASNALSSLNWWIDAKRLPLDVDHAPLLIHTLARLGGQASDIWPIFKAYVGGATQDKLAQEIALAQTDVSMCD